MTSTDTIQVLHVDDEPDLAEVVATFLEREDDRMQVRTATSPEDGLELLDEHPTDCVVSDYDMPGTNGIQFLETVRERDPDIPFILYTGKGSEEIASDAISAGVTDYLQKESGTSQYTVLANRIENAVEQYRSREAIQEAERKLRELAERTDDVLFMFDGDWNELLFVNSAYEELWGRPIADLEADPDAFLDQVHADDSQRVRSSLACLADGDSVQLEFRIVRPDGQQRWVRSNAKPVLDSDGDMVRIVGQVRDITEQKERELQLETFIDNLPGYVYRHGYEPGYPLEFVLGDAKAITGYTARELEDDVTLAEEVIHPDDRETVWTEHVERIESNGQYDLTYRILTKSGEERWIRDQGQLIENPVTGEAVIEGLITDVTERKKQEQQLVRTSELLRQTEKLTDVGGWEADASTGVQQWTAGTYRIHDLDPDGAFDPSVESGIDFYHPEDRETIESAVNRCLSKGEPYEVECRLITDNDRVRWVQTVGVPIREDGEIVGARGAIQDVTERKQRERELEQIQDFFAEAEQLGKLGAWEFDVEGNVTWTAGTRRIHGVGEEFEPTLEEAIEFFHPEDRERIEEAVERALERGESYELEVRLVTADGDERWIRTRGEVLPDGDTVRGYIQDITEAKERERELQQAHGQLENAIEAGAVGTWEWHVPEDRIVAGQQFARTFGVDPETAQEGVPLKRFVSSIHEDDRDRVEQAIETALEACGEYEAEYRVRDAEGTLHWVLARGHVECDENGTPIRFPGVLIDITERKRMERELQRQNERLDEFASVISHDLKNPLNVATGRLELLADECDSEQLQHIEGAHERMENLIEQLLTFARGREAVTDREPCDLAAVVEGCWKTVETADATLVNEVDRTVSANENRLRQVLENLIRNAVEHGSTSNQTRSDDAVEHGSTGNRTKSDDAVEHGRSGVTITVGDLDDGFYVEDDGPGIDEVERDKVFETGYTSATEGTGFGLRIVEQIVEAHDWEIRLTEGSDGGARFEIRTERGDDYADSGG